MEEFKRLMFSNSASNQQSIHYFKRVIYHKIMDGKFMEGLQWLRDKNIKYYPLGESPGNSAKDRLMLRMYNEREVWFEREDDMLAFAIIYSELLKPPMGQTRLPTL